MSDDNEINVTIQVSKYTHPQLFDILSEIPLRKRAEALRRLIERGRLAEIYNGTLAVSHPGKAVSLSQSMKANLSGKDFCQSNDFDAGIFE